MSFVLCLFCFHSRGALCLRNYLSCSPKRAHNKRHKNTSAAILSCVHYTEHDNTIYLVWDSEIGLRKSFILHPRGRRLCGRRLPQLEGCRSDAHPAAQIMPQKDVLPYVDENRNRRAGPLDHRPSQPVGWQLDRFSLNSTTDFRCRVTKLKPKILVN